jgi:hypothetical protein
MPEAKEELSLGQMKRDLVMCRLVTPREVASWYDRGRPISKIS